jgi:hypothetical protein
MGRIERPPNWILKYQERIEKGTITVEEILAEENKIREVPIKRSSVTRAINAMGYPITGLQIEKGEEEEAQKPVETRGEPGRIEKGPGWLQKYRERIEKGTITVEEILAEENKIREVPIKMSSVKRAINSMGYPITRLQIEKKEEKEEAQKPVETRGKPEGIEKGPGWLQKYRERIEKGTITVEEILAEENKTREVPIKRSSVTRAINAIGYPITGLRMEKKGEEDEEAQKPVETRGKPEGIEKGPGWLQKYRERIEKGTITVEEILAEENKIRKVPIKRSSVTRAINAIGYPITGLRIEKKEGVKEVEKPKREAEEVVYSSSIGKISEETVRRFNAMKKSWEDDLGKPLHNDYFVNILLALAKLIEHGKVLTPVKG